MKDMKSINNVYEFRYLKNVIMSEVKLFNFKIKSLRKMMIL